MQNTKLKSQKIVETVGLLKTRIEERFPDSSLSRVCGDLKQIAKEVDIRVDEIAQNRIGYRLIVFIFAASVLAFAGVGLSRAEFDIKSMTVSEMLVILDSLFNIVFLIGGAILFLVSIENRTKRRKVVKAVNALRCLAHIIDSHQLTKDPCYIRHQVIKTNHSPERTLDSFLLNRYLNYCSEMLSLVSKIAFLYVQDYHDAVATKAVKDLEDLTNGLSRKIWQKIINIRQEQLVE